jgi:hypothetical protein
MKVQWFSFKPYLTSYSGAGSWWVMAVKNLSKRTSMLHPPKRGRRDLCGEKLKNLLLHSEGSSIFAGFVNP